MKFPLIVPAFVLVLTVPAHAMNRFEMAQMRLDAAVTRAEHALLVEKFTRADANELFAAYVERAEAAGLDLVGTERGRLRLEEEMADLVARATRASLRFEDVARFHREIVEEKLDRALARLTAAGHAGTISRGEFVELEALFTERAELAIDRIAAQSVLGRMHERLEDLAARVVGKEVVTEDDLVPTRRELIADRIDEALAIVAEHVRNGRGTRADYLRVEARLAERARLELGIGGGEVVIETPIDTVIVK